MLLNPGEWAYILYLVWFSISYSVSVDIIGQMLKLETILQFSHKIQILYTIVSVRYIPPNFIYGQLDILL